MTDHADSTPLRPGPECASVVDLLPLLADGALAASETARVRAHLAGCAYCQAQRALYDRMEDAVRRYVGAAAIPPIQMEDVMSPPNARSHKHPERMQTSAAGASALPTTAAPRRSHRRARSAAFVRSAAAVLVVGALVGGFAALLHARLAGQGGQLLTNYRWQVVPSPNTSQAVNTLTGITVRSATDAWAWGVSNDAPSGVNSNPTVVPLVEHWDGKRWSIVATPPPPQGGQITDIVAIAADDAWAVGSQTTGGPENTGSAPLVEHWDGHSWTIRPDAVGDATGGAGGLGAVAALSADDIWAVGASPDPAGMAGLIEHWDGHSWRAVTHPVPSSGVQFGAIAAVAPDDIWATGTVHSKNGATTFEHWNGSRWSIVASPPPGGIGPLTGDSQITAVSAVAANDIWAAGFAYPVIPFPNGAGPLFEHWDGHSWSIVNGPSVDAAISGIVALGPDDVWAVGTTVVGQDVAQRGQGVIEHWDGHVWSLVANPTPRSFTSLGGVAGDPSAPGKVWVAGTIGPEISGRDQLTDTQTLIETNQ